MARGAAVPAVVPRVRTGRGFPVSGAAAAPVAPVVDAPARAVCCRAAPRVSGTCASTPWGIRTLHDLGSSRHGDGCYPVHQQQDSPLHSQPTETSGNSRMSPGLPGWSRCSFGTGGDTALGDASRAAASFLLPRPAAFPLLRAGAGCTAPVLARARLVVCHGECHRDAHTSKTCQVIY